jgi:hypothetical protein
MKNHITTLFLFLLFTTCFSQNYKFEYSGRFSPSIKKEKLRDAQFLNEIMPEFPRYVSMPYQERAQLDQLLASVQPSQENYSYPLGNYFHVQKDYEKIFDYVTIEISTISHGKTLTYGNTNDALTIEQKNSLNSADFGTDIRIKIRFKYKNWAMDNSNTGRAIKEAQYAVTVIPETEAAYPGGFKQLTSYLTKNIMDKASERTSEKIQQAIVRFSVNEDGQPVDVRLFKTSTDLKTDQLIMDAINNMPRWKPAKNAEGVIVKEEISIPFGGGGC